MGEKEKLRSEMHERIMNEGAWFCTGKGRFVKIGYSREDDCYFARECFRRDGGLQGGAYSFGKDWFDISFHGKYIDIYADAETFRDWGVSHDGDRSVSGDPAEQDDTAMRLLEFCRAADAEAEAGDPAAYRISGTNFDKILEIRGERR